MSTSNVVTAIPPSGLISRRVRAYFAPVNRATEAPTLFDPASAAQVMTAGVSGPWIDLGWISELARISDTKIAAVAAGTPSVSQYQVRQAGGATVTFLFEQWTKLSMALAGGAEHMNVLTPAAGATANGSGGIAGVAQPVMFGGAVATSASFIGLAAADAAKYTSGSLVAVDVDYTGQVGFVGSGISAAYVKSAVSVNSDVSYVRRVTFNVARVQQVTLQGLQLAQLLIAGVPTAGMKVQPLLGFVDREGGSFLQEWSALFVMSGEQGDAVFFHYPRLQAMQGAAESTPLLLAPLEKLLLKAAFRALPVVDAVDAQTIVCFRTYVPSPNATV